MCCSRYLQTIGVALLRSRYNDSFVAIILMCVYNRSHPRHNVEHEIEEADFRFVSVDTSGHHLGIVQRINQGKCSFSLCSPTNLIFKFIQFAVSIWKWKVRQTIFLHVLQDIHVYILSSCAWTYITVEGLLQKER